MSIFDKYINENIEIVDNINIGKICAFKCVGNIKCICFPKTINELIYFVDYCFDNNLQFNLVGNCTNILPLTKDSEKIYISTKKMKNFSIDSNNIYAECGVNLIKLAKICCDRGLSGMEGLCGIPGSVGGGINMNCGAYGYEIGNIVKSGLVYNQGKIENWAVEDFEFQYRKSSLSNNKKLILLSAEFELKFKSIAEIEKETQGYKEKRKLSQPHLPSLGCVFKKVNEMSAGYYIDKLGLKGARVGGAMVALEHANFIVNVGGATVEDYINLVDKIEKKVYNYYGIKLEKEVIYAD